MSFCGHKHNNNFGYPLKNSIRGSLGPRPTLLPNKNLFETANVEMNMRLVLNTYVIQTFKFDVRHVRRLRLWHELKLINNNWTNTQ